LDSWNTCGSSNENDLVDLILALLGVIENVLNGLEGSLEEIIVELFELGSGEGLGQI